MKKIVFILLLFLMTNSCAQLYHVQLGEVISHPQFNSQPFDIKVSEVGVSLEDTSRILEATNNKDAAQATEIIGLFQLGPRTGNPVYTKNYAKNLQKMLYERCPSGRITGLMSVRESRKYPVISGEIVKITGYCLVPKGI